MESLKQTSFNLKVRSYLTRALVQDPAQQHCQLCRSEPVAFELRQKGMQHFIPELLVITSK